MKWGLTSILMSIAILLAITSCATVSKEPLAPGQLRLLGASMAGSGVAFRGTPAEVKITFQSDSKPNIRRICFTRPGEEQACYGVRPKDVEYGSPGSITVMVPPPAKTGPSRVDCFVEYWQDSKVLRTNVINFSVESY